MLWILNGELTFCTWQPWLTISSSPLSFSCCEDTQVGSSFSGFSGFFFVLFCVTSFDVTVKMCNSLEILILGSSCTPTCPRGAYEDGLSMSFWLGAVGVWVARATVVQPWACTSLSSPQPQELGASFSLWKHSLYQERGLGWGRSATVPCYLFWVPLLHVAPVVSPSTLTSQQVSRQTCCDTPHRKDISTWKLTKKIQKLIFHRTPHSLCINLLDFPFFVSMRYN